MRYTSHLFTTLPNPLIHSTARCSCWWSGYFFFTRRFLRLVWPLQSLSRSVWRKMRCHVPRTQGRTIVSNLPLWPSWGVVTIVRLIGFDLLALDLQTELPGLTVSTDPTGSTSKCLSCRALMKFAADKWRQRWVANYCIFSTGPRVNSSPVSFVLSSWSSGHSTGLCMNMMWLSGRSLHGSGSHTHTCFYLIMMFASDIYDASYAMFIGVISISNPARNMKYKR